MILLVVALVAVLLALAAPSFLPAALVGTRRFLAGAVLRR